LPRIRRPPRRIDDGVPQHVFASVEKYYKREYFEAIDIIIGELERRFLQESFSFVREIEKLLLDSANAKSANLPEKIESIYGEDLDMERLKNSAKDAPGCCQGNTNGWYSHKGGYTCTDFMLSFEYSAFFQDPVIEVHKLLKNYLTIPVTTSTVERNFSAL